MSVKRVLVVGGAGYIGAHAAKALARAGREPVVFDNLSTGQAQAVKWGPLVIGDMRDADALRAAIRKHRPDAVMHFAARIEIAEGEADPAAFYDANVAGALTVAQTMLQEGVNRLVFSSTCAVYGDPGSSPVSEDAPLRPVNVYGRTKLMAEQMLADIARASGLSFAALRYFNAAGADPDGDIGEARDTASHLIANALNAAAGRGPPLRIFGDDYPTPDGTCVRDFVHVSDLADAHILAADSLAYGARNLRLNLGSGHGASVRDVIRAVERVVGRPLPCQAFTRRAGDAASLCADTSRARQILGWRPRLSSLDEIIATAWRFRNREPLAGAAAAGDLNPPRRELVHR